MGTGYAGRVKRRTWIAIALIAAVALAYVGFAWMYSTSTSPASDFTPKTPPAGGLDIDVIPQFFDPTTETVTVVIRIDADPSFYGPNGTLSQGIEVALSPTLDQNVFIFPAGSPEMAVTARLEVEGAVRNYPFDVHRTRLTATAQRLDPQSVALPKALPLNGGVRLSDGLSQWNVESESNAVGSSTERLDLSLSFSRSDTTKTSALLMIAMMLTLGVVVALVMWWVATARREVDFGMVTWFAALTFALITVRNNLPGAPPIGSWVDVLVFFWVQFILLLALSVCMTVWLRAPRNDKITNDERQDVGSKPGSPGSITLPG